MDFYDFYDIDKSFCQLVEEEEERLAPAFGDLKKIEEENQLKVLASFKKNELSTSDFIDATGYGYGDRGRDTVEAIFSTIFHTEDALVRPNIVSGTHALSIVLFALLNYGDKLVSLGGLPYDTLLQVIGFKGNKKGNLIERGITFDYLPLDENNKIQIDKFPYVIDDKTKLVMLQRSTGYSDRRAFTIDELAEAIQAIKKINKDVIIFVDNCYGEFTENREPTEVGADIVAGSLIKNLGGGIALTGGYICGKKDLVEYCANTLTAPGIGKDEGLSFQTTRKVLEGLYFSPHTTMEAVKVGMLFGRVFERLGFRAVPETNDPQSDIVQAIVLEDPEKLILFCKSIQEICSVDSELVPIPDDMPGYDCKVIMSAGGFVEGATSELSADGPLREPYIAYLQGGLNYFQGKLALLKVLTNFKREGYL